MRGELVAHAAADAIASNNEVEVIQGDAVYASLEAHFDPGCRAMPLEELEQVESRNRRKTVPVIEMASSR